MDKLIKMFRESSLFVRALLILPIILMAAFYGIPALLNREESKRKKVDKKDQGLDKEISKAKKESSVHEGEVSRLEKEKAEQLETLNREDPISFHNKRKKK
jgi:hypothetical protein